MKHNRLRVLLAYMLCAFLASVFMPTHAIAETAQPHAGSDGNAATPIVTARASSTPPKFTEFAIYDKSLEQGGTPLFDLLHGDTPKLAAGTEYYLVVKVQKGLSTDDTWVSITLPWWINAENMVGGNNWNVAGSSVNHTAIDKVLAYDAPPQNTSGVPTYASNAKPTSAGTVVYHISNSAAADIKEAGFQLSFKPDIQYANGGTPEQTYALPNNQLSGATGFMSGDHAGVASDIKVTNKIIQTSGIKFNYYETNFPYISFNEEAESSRTMWLGPWSSNSVITSIEFDAVYPTAATVKNIKYSGKEMTLSTPVDNGDGTSTIHAILNTPDGWVPNRSVSATASFPASVGMGTQTMKINNVKGYIWGDEAKRAVTSTTELKWNIAEGTRPILETYNTSRYDWLGQESINQNTLLGGAKLYANGPASASPSNSLSVRVTYPNNAIVRAITVPLFEGHGDTIKINGTSYTLDDVAKIKGKDYACIRNIDLGLGENDTISSVEFEMGKLHNGQNTYGGGGDHSDATQDNKLAAYGSYKDGKQVSTEYEVFETGTDPDSSDNTTYATKNASSNPEKNKRVGYSRSLVGQATKSKLIAGESTTVTLTAATHAWPGYVDTSNTTYDKNPSFYVVVPSNITMTDFKIGDTPVEATDITDTDFVQAKPTDGTRILKIDTAAGTEIGYYKTDQTLNDVKLSFTFGTKSTMQAATLNLADMVFVGQGDVPKNGQYLGSGGSTNKYKINGNLGLAAARGTINIQEFKGLEVSNAMRVDRNGRPKGEWKVYSAADPENTRAVVGKDYEATYRVTVVNRTGENAKDARIFVPIPKENQDFGPAFNPAGPQQFDMQMVSTGDIPEGWKIIYAKMHDGAHYVKGHVPDDSDYDVVDDPANADMLVIARDTDTEIPNKGSFEFFFTLTSPNYSDIREKAGSTNTWSAATKFVTGTSTTIPEVTYPESVTISKANLSGTIYHDKNNNGVMDAGETGIPGVIVRSTQSFDADLPDGTTSEQTVEYSAVTDANGEYSMIIDGSAGVRDTKVDVTVVNPSAGAYRFSPTTEKGNRPSVVTADADESTATKAGLVSTPQNLNLVVDAGLNNPPIESKGDLAVTTQKAATYTTEHDAVYEVNQDDKLDIAFAFTTGNIKEQLAKGEEGLFPDGAPRAQINLSEVNAKILATVTYPKGVDVHGASFELKSLNVEDYAADADDNMYEISGTPSITDNSDGTTTVVAELVLKNADSYKNYEQLYDAVQKQSDYMSLVAKGISVLKAPVNTQLTLSAKVSGSISSKVDYKAEDVPAAGEENHNAKQLAKDFLIVWNEAKQDTALPGNIDGTDAVLADADEHPIQLTLIVHPVKPDQPNKPDKPGKPDKPNKPSKPSNPAAPGKKNPISPSKKTTKKAVRKVLPQTSDLLLPVGSVAVAGIVIVAAAIILRKRNK